jgi:hypothetical protein
VIAGWIAGWPLQQFRLHQSVFGKRQAAVVGDDHVIEHADVDQLQGFAQPSRDQFVGLTGLGDAGWMIMRLMCPRSFCARRSEGFVVERDFFGRRHITTGSSQGMPSPAELDGWLHRVPNTVTRSAGVGEQPA